MGLRPKHVFQRLNRARLDSASLSLHRFEIVDGYRALRDRYEAWIAGESAAPVSISAQAFMDTLSRIFLVSPKALVLKDSPRPHQRDGNGRIRGELYGSCTFQGSVQVYLRTAAHGRPTAFKTFFNTLVHEWVHHYDFEALGDTVHCAGFYERVRSIYQTCLEVEVDECPKPPQ